MATYILEDQSTFEKFHSEIKKDPEAVVLALSPEAHLFAKQYGIKCIQPSDFVTEVEYAAAKKQSETILLELVQELDGFTMRREGQLKLGTYFGFQLYVVIGMLHQKIFILDQYTKKYSPEKIVSAHFAGELGTWLGFRLNMKNLYTDLLNLNHAKKFQFEQMEMPFVPAAKVPLKERILSFFRDVFYKTDWLVDLAGKRKHNLPIFNRTRKKVMLFLGALYDWEFSIPDLSKHFHIDFIFQGHFSRGNRFSKDIQAIFEKSLALNFLGYPISKMFSVQYELMSGMYEEALKNKIHYLKMLKKVDAVSCAVVPYPMQLYLCHLARTQNVPVSSYQHGEMHASTKDYFFSYYSESIMADYYFTWGQAVNPKFEQYPLKKIYPVGSARIGSILNANNMTKKYPVLYVAGKYFYFSLPFYDFVSVSPDETLADYQSNVLIYLDEVHKRTQKKIYIKPNNTPGLNALIGASDSIIKLPPQLPFSTICHEAELIILDAPSTTAIEACTTDAYLFVGMGQLEWNADAIKLLEKRAVICYSPQDLVTKLEQFFANGVYEADRYNREFLEAFGVKSFEQTKEAVVKAALEITRSK